MSITREEQARRAMYLTDLMWPVGAFLFINAFFWALDVLVGEQASSGPGGSPLFWGVALAFHVLAYLVVGRRWDGRTGADHERR